MKEGTLKILGAKLPATNIYFGGYINMNSVSCKRDFTQRGKLEISALEFKIHEQKVPGSIKGNSLFLICTGDKGSDT